MYPVKSIGLLFDAKNVTPGSNWVDGVGQTGNAEFGLNCANAIYLATSNRVDVVLLDGKTIVSFVGMAAGIWIGMPPFRHIQSASTTATGIVVGITAG